MAAPTEQPAVSSPRGNAQLSIASQPPGGFMRNIRSGTSRRQQGFIQGAILFALGLLVVIIGAFSMANSNSSVNADAERDRTNAAVVVKVSVDLQTAVERALQDGHALSALRFSSDSTQEQAEVLAQGETPGKAAVPATVGLYDTRYRYANAPNLPAAAIESGPTYAFATKKITGIGTDDGNDSLLEITGLTKQVCRRAEAIANGTAYDALATVPTTPAAKLMAGCYNSSATGTGQYTFYRVLAAS